MRKAERKKVTKKERVKKGERKRVNVPEKNKGEKRMTGRKKKR